MNYRKGKQFESAVEMFEWLSEGEKAFNSNGKPLTIDHFGAWTINSYFKRYHQAIEEKEDEIKEFWLWDHVGLSGAWMRTTYYYSSEFMGSEGIIFDYLKGVSNSKKRKVESSKIKINMRTLKIVE